MTQPDRPGVPVPAGGWVTRLGHYLVAAGLPRYAVLRAATANAAENAAETLTALKAQWEVDKNRQTEALVEIWDRLEIRKAA